MARILIIEDDRDIVELVRYLEREGFDVRAVFDGTGYLAALRKELPNLLVLARYYTAGNVRS